MGRHAGPARRSGDGCCTSAADGLHAVLSAGRVAIVASPVDGHGRCGRRAGSSTIRADGLGLAGRSAGDSRSVGRCCSASRRPDAELRPRPSTSALAGSDPRGRRAAGHRGPDARPGASASRGIICGGVVGRELRQLEESDARQRAALHAAAPFACWPSTATAGGPSRRTRGTCSSRRRGPPGRHLSPESRLVDHRRRPAEAVPASGPPGSVRHHRRRGARAVGTPRGLAGPRRRPGGMYLPSGFVEEAGRERARPSADRAAPDLERLG